MAGSGRPARQDNDLLERLTDLTDHRLSRAAVAAAVETGRALLKRPSVRASLEAAVLSLLPGAGEHFQSVDWVGRSADRLALILQERGILRDRIGVDGLPGSGKSALARALAHRLGLRWKSLDHENMNVPRDFTQEGTIYEHHRLFRTQEVDVFDALVYLDEPVEVCRARVLRRATSEARRAVIIDMLDYPRLKMIGKLAFDVCDGEPISIPGSRLLVKPRPPGGFRAVENIAGRLHAAGHDPAGLGKEEMLFLLACGRPRAGLRAYFLPGAFTEELLSGLVAGMRGYLAE